MRELICGYICLHTGAVNRCLHKCKFIRHVVHKMISDNIIAKYKIKYSIEKVDIKNFRGSETAM